MARHFPYVSAGVTTAAVGALTSVVFAAQVPVMHPVAPHPAAHAVPAAVGAVGGGPAAATPGGAAATTGTFPGTAPLAQPNTPGSAPPAQPPGFQQSAAYGQTGMNQPGQPPYGEMFYSMQTYMNQPGQPDYYDRLGINPTALQASEGVQPFTTYQGQVGSQATTGTATTNSAATTPPNSLGRTYTPTNTGNTVGFYNGFGPGNPNFGFYAGFTTPR